MAKAKNKKRISSDRVHNKKDQKKLNPFEVHVNKEKLKVIGKKQKNDRGLPGISRAKAIQKRKSTLLEEYKVQNKDNKFVDRRIGEKGHMNYEEKAMARFAAVKMKSHNKKNIFNLADDEILTHKGQTLNEIEKFDDPRSDEDDFSDSENKTGNLESNFIKEAHFGGGLFKNTGKEGAMTHKDLINQLIVESKKRKAEKQKLKEATLDLTEKLDSEWKDLIPLVNSNTQNQEDEVKKQIDDYDKVMRELRFEKRGTVSDRLKTEDEIAKEEKENLEKLEEERIKRMYNEEEKPKQYHRSADDLDDGFAYDDIEEDIEENILSYNTKGESNVEIEANINGTILKSNKNQINDNEVEEKPDNENDEEQNNDNDEEESSGEELETDSEDNLSDLKEEDSASEDDDAREQSEDDKETEENERQSTDEDVPKLKKVTQSNKELKNVNKSNDDVLNEAKNKNTKRKENNKTDVQIVKEFPKNEESGGLDKQLIETSEETLDIPFTFNLPESYESLLKSLETYKNYEDIVIQRMVKCNHPSLSERNKSKLGLLFAYTLQYLNDLFAETMDKKETKAHFDIFQRLVPQIYDLAKLNPDNAHNSVLEVIKEKFEDYKKRPKVYPGLEMLVFFKLVSILFPTSDFRHQIVTPCFVFMEQILTKCKIKGGKDIAYGLFISSLVLEYSALTKRYLPAVINYLSGLLHMAIPKTGVKLIKIPPPFKSTSSDLVLTENYSLENFKTLKLNSTVFCTQEITSKYKVRVLYNVVKLLEQYLEHYKMLPSHVEIFEKVLHHLELIPVSSYPKIVQDSLNKLIEMFKNSKNEKKLDYLVMDAARPKALRLYEPKVQVIYDGKQHKSQSKEKAQHSKLMHKLKMEKKGALREIRRDNAFLGRVKINKQLQSDMERREKVKRIYSEASIQQSELNEIDRKKKRKH